jgi:hypothetical protein
MNLDHDSLLYIPGNELVVLLVAARGAVVARVGDEGGHVQDLGEVDPGGDLLVQPARVLESVTDKNCYSH